MEQATASLRQAEAQLTVRRNALDRARRACAGFPLARSFLHRGDGGGGRGSAAVGVFFGFYPAWKASRLDPIVALRHE